MDCTSCGLEDAWRVPSCVETSDEHSFSLFGWPFFPTTYTSWLLYIDTYYIDVSYYVLFFQLFYLCILFRVNKWRVIPYLYSSVSENISLSCACIFMSFVLLSFLWCGLACIMVQVWLHPWKLTWTLEKSPFVNREIHLQNVGFSIVMSSFGGWIFNLFWRYDGRRKKSSKLRACNYTSNTHLELQDVSTVFGSFLFGGGIWVNSFPNSLKQI